MEEFDLTRSNTVFSKTETELEKVISNLNEANEKLEKNITDLINKWLANYNIISELPDINKNKYSVGVDYTRDLLSDLVNYFKFLED